MRNVLFLPLLMAIIFLSVSCSVSLKKPETNLVAQVTAHNAAYLFAKNNPTEAKKLIQGPLPRFLDALTEDTATQVFNSFSTTLLDLAITPYAFRSSFQAFLALIDIDLKGQHPARSLFIVNQVITHFLNGLKLGCTK